MEAWDNLAHQVTLLAINPETGRVRRRTDLALATAGRALAELALQGGSAWSTRRFRCTTPTDGGPLLDTMLRVLAEQGERRPTRILDTARKGVLGQALGRLVTNGWVIMTPG